MGRSWRIGRIFGIDVYAHFTFLLLLGWVALTHYLTRHEWVDALSGLLFIVTLFGIVVLHELGHALAARRFGIRTRDITLLPIGGVARLERMPDEPRQELLVALAGPAVNVALAVALLGVIQLGAGLAAPGKVVWGGGRFLDQLLWVNVFLAAFNLLPAFPMDGGRVLRALLAMRMDYVRATRIAASIGQTIALVFGYWGLFGNPFLLLIALFVWVGAAQEANMVRLRSALARVPIGRAMITDFRTLNRSSHPLGPVTGDRDFLLLRELVPERRQGGVFDDRWRIVSHPKWRVFRQLTGSGGGFDLGRGSGALSRTG